MLLKGHKVAAEKAEADRQKAITYKRVFGTPEGREVLMDLMNRYHILNSHGGDVFKEGQRSVVLDVLGRAHVDLTVLDKLLRGEIG